MAEKEKASRAVATWSPFRQLQDLQDEINKLWESFPTPFQRGTPVAAGLWAPVVDVFRKNGSVIVKAELPGLTEKDIEVTVSDEAVVLTGEKSEEKETRQEDFFRCERSYGHFSRQIPLPARGDPEKAKATFKDGVLEVEVPLQEPLPKEKKVEIKAAV
ncbi:MAG TPA: Hsp20/alpha crystallin family protein [Dehalococcoidia bacterium]|jgi:HSP20 family protein